MDLGQILLGAAFGSPLSALVTVWATLHAQKKRRSSEAMADEAVKSAKATEYWEKHYKSLFDEGNEILKYARIAVTVACREILTDERISDINLQRTIDRLSAYIDRMGDDRPEECKNLNRLRLQLEGMNITHTTTMARDVQHKIIFTQASEAQQARSSLEAADEEVRKLYGPPQEIAE